jgi:formylglycine-generating enzyme required for sulfatase activity
MMLVDLNNLDVCVDRWEASRPDSSSVTPGSIDDGMAISRPGVLPWVALDRASALTACRKAGRDRWPGDGKDLCTVNQWQQACIYTGRIELDPDWVYPYGRTYDPTRCNGLDADRNRSEATGSFEGCSVLDIIRGAMDMSGNVAEWVDERVEGQRAILGGSYLSEKDALKCEAPELVSSNAEELHIGFRCCKGLSNN